MNKIANLIKELSSTVPAYHKPNVCKKHYLQEQYTCTNPSCQFYFKQFCKECGTHTHNNVPINSIRNKILTKLTQGYEQIQKEHKIMKQVKRQAETNLEYCIDLFSGLKKDIQEEVKAQPYENLLQDALKLFSYQKDQIDFLRRSKQFGKQHSIQWENNNFIFDQAEKALLKIKQNKQKLQIITTFSKKSLETSQNMFKILKPEKKKQKSVLEKNTKSQKWAKITNLRNIETDAQSNSNKLTIDLKRTSMNQSTDIQKLISRIKNLQFLEIKAKNLQLKRDTWNSVIKTIPSMDYLNELSIHLAGNLSAISSDFKQNHQKLETINKFHLKVTDQSVVIDNVVQICSSFNCEVMRITLSRCQLTFVQIKHLIDSLCSQVKQNSMKELSLILTVNKLWEKQKFLIKNYFEQKCLSLKVKKYSIQV